MCLKDENNFITFYFSLFPFFTHNNSHLHRRIMCFTRKRETTMCLACKKRPLFYLCFACTYRINVGMGHGKYKSPGLLLLCQEDEFPSCSIQCQFRFYRCIVQDAFNAPRNSKAGPIRVSEKEISIILLVANLATSIVCRQNTKVTRLFLAIFFFTQELNLSCIFHIVVVLHVFFSLHEI